MLLLHNKLVSYDEISWAVKLITKLPSIKMTGYIYVAMQLIKLEVVNKLIYFYYRE